MNKYLFYLFVLPTAIILTSCKAVEDYVKVPSENSNYRVNSLVIHYTAANFTDSMRMLVDKDGLSSHYLLPALGDESYPHDEIKVFKLVDETERAWHAGVSRWQRREGLNDTSIGIEIVNMPICRTFHDAQGQTDLPSYSGIDVSEETTCIFPDFEPKQIEVLIELIHDIQQRNPDIKATSIVGHSDIAPSRKQDPGPRFPWYTLYKNGIGAWYNSDSFFKHLESFIAHPLSIGLFQKALSTYGYGVEKTDLRDQTTTDTITAFQMHFLPWQVNGQLDAPTSAVIFALLEKYFPIDFEEINQSYLNELFINYCNRIKSKPNEAPTERQNDANKEMPEEHQKAKRKLSSGDVKIDPDNC